jgi:HPt (histidine-containing phosphotransfer) domain-containing protein
LNIAIDTLKDTTTAWLPPNSGVEHVVATCLGAGCAPVWSLTTELREIMDVDPGMMPDLVSLFLHDSTARLQILSTACVRQDFKMAGAQAHSLKGSALQMGAARLASLCASLESSHSSGPDECGPVLRAIGSEFALVRRAMEEYLIAAEIAGLPQRQPALDSST